MKEIWKPVVGYEGLYEVSNIGRVKSLDRYVDTYGGRTMLVYGHIVSQRYDKDGYLQCRLSLGGKQKQFLVHRLVAQAYIPNPDNLPCVNHKNELKTDNRSDNLEWCSIRYNNTYGNRIQKEINTKVNNGKYNPNHLGLPNDEQKKLWYIEHRDELNKKKRERRRTAGALQIDLKGRGPNKFC